MVVPTKIFMYGQAKEIKMLNSFNAYIFHRERKRYGFIICHLEQNVYVPIPSPLMYYRDYQFDWLCAYTVVLLGKSI